MEDGAQRLMDVIGDYYCCLPMFLIIHGYLGSTLLACRAMARPHIELGICKKSFSVE